MTRISSFLIASVLAALLMWQRAWHPAIDERSSCFVLEEVATGSAAERAGLEAGDCFLAWRRDPASFWQSSAEGRFDSPFALGEVFSEQAPRGPIRLLLRRDGELRELVVPADAWRLRLRPADMPERALAIYAEGKALLAEGEIAAGLERWEEAVEELRAGGERGTATWLTLRVAALWSQQRQNERARAAFETALGDAESLDDPLAIAVVARVFGQHCFRNSDFDRADEVFHRALAALRRLAPEGLWAAELLTDLGGLWWSRGELDKAERFYQRAMDLREAVLPEESLEIAASLNNLGMMAHTRGDLASAVRSYRRALPLWEKLAPDSLELTATLNNLGNLTRAQGDFAQAESYHRRVLAIKEKLGAEPLEVALSLDNLGVLASERGDLSAAEALHRQALAIREEHAPESLEVAASLNNLALIPIRRGDLATAEALLWRSLELRRRLAPEGLETAYSLENLGVIARRVGDLAGAEAYHRQALALRRLKAPDSLAVASSLTSLGSIALERDERDEAEALYRRALELIEKVAPESLDLGTAVASLARVVGTRGDQRTARQLAERALEVRERLAPGSLSVADSLDHLAGLALDAGELGRARSLYERALRVRQALAPGSAGEASSWHGLARVEAAAGRAEQALELYGRALEALERQGARLSPGDDLGLARLTARHADFYRAPLALLVQLGRLEEAFAVHERYRARGFRRLLAERELVFALDLPPELDRERRRINGVYDRALERLAELASDDAERRAALQSELRELRRQQQEIRAEVRARSPELGALEEPSALDLRAVREQLDPGTLLLSYAVGEPASLLFAVGPGVDELEVFQLDLGEQALRHGVEQFRAALGPGQSRDGARLLSRHLAERLLGPATEALRRAERLLILPDGPLHVLPFAALELPLADGAFHYLIEEKPLHVAASAVVYAELKKRRRPRREVRISAFGDPVDARRALAEPASPGSSGSLTMRDGRRLAPLPTTRFEVESLGALYPEAAQLYLGAAASEERAKALDEDTTLVHFACHGVFDPRSPLDSALVLTIPDEAGGERDNGFLQAWEIFEQVRLDADLVTLSACDSGLGEELAGEGLIGLTRAFQYAGARSVLASLWPIADLSTAELMRRFYGYLKAGDSKDEALRRAQIDFLRGRVEIVIDGERKRMDVAHPFFWSAFEIVGDWR